MSDKNKTLIVIAGPTASGKTAFAIKVAKALDTVILSADSRQFYKEMSIGTAAPTEEELSQAKHYFVHHISIEDKYDVADYERDALQLLGELFKTHDTVVMTGGSGLFIDAVCNGIDAMPDVEPEIREKVEKLYHDEGLHGMQEVLQRLDPDYYAIVDQQNPRRLQRALEVCYQTGKPFSFSSHRQAGGHDDGTRATQRSQGALSQTGLERLEHCRLQRIIRLFRRQLQPKRSRGANQDSHAAIRQTADDLVKKRHKLPMGNN